MSSSDETWRGLTGAWRMMTGRADGLRMLDLSADGFWNSFAATIVALPPLFVGWSGFAADLAARPGYVSSRLSVLPRLALIEYVVWLLPLLFLGFVARRVGIADRFVGYVVATNWGSALFAWMALPLLLLRITVPMSEDAGVRLSLAFFGLQLVLSWRLTNLAIGRGAAMGAAVFAAMLAVSIVLMLALQALFGVSAAP